MSTIYIVQGETGEYEDYKEWPVKAFSNDERAAEFVNMLNCKLEALEFSESSQSISFENRQNRAFLSQMEELDPNFSVDYTGTKYSMYPLELVE